MRRIAAVNVSIDIATPCENIHFGGTISSKTSFLQHPIASQSLNFLYNPRCACNHVMVMTQSRCQQHADCESSETFGIKGWRSSQWALTLQGAMTSVQTTKSWAFWSSSFQMCPSWRWQQLLRIVWGGTISIFTDEYIKFGKDLSFTDVMFCMKKHALPIAALNFSEQTQPYQRLPPSCSWSYLCFIELKW